MIGCGTCPKRSHTGMHKIRLRIPLPQQRLHRVLKLEIGDVNADGAAIRALQQVNGLQIRGLIVPLPHIGEILIVPSACAER